MHEEQIGLHPRDADQRFPVLSKQLGAFFFFFCEFGKEGRKEKDEETNIKVKILIETRAGSNLKEEKEKIILKGLFVLGEETGHDGVHKGGTEGAKGILLEEQHFLVEFTQHLDCRRCQVDVELSQTKIVELDDRRKRLCRC